MSKYICLSDTHLGQNGKDSLGYYSTLSQGVKENKIATLAKQVKDFANGDKITLVGVGDVLDLSMATMHDCLDDLICLLKQLPEVDKFQYVVGNHDAKAWSLSCEELALEDMYNGHIPLQGTIYNVAKERYFSALTNLLAEQLGRMVCATISYPSFTLSFNDTEIYFTHGHLFGDIYTTLSDILKNALSLKNKSFEEKLATVNLPIIEFIYWLLGEMGCGMGVDGLVEAIYSDHDKGNNSLLKKAVNDGIDALMANGFIKGIPDSWERWLVKKVINNALDKNAKERKFSLASKSRYADTSATRQQLEKYIGNVGITPMKKNIFVAGHTHVPDEYDFIETDNNSRMSTFINFKTYNLGGWLVEPDHPTPQGGILMIDTDKNSLEFKVVNS